jgi:cellulose synthase/poly-beta-1,6-N-acetylglucosamine synthase-like glycosyltransferase
MTLLFALVCCVGCVWLLVFGYALVLAAVRPFPRSSAPILGSLPRVTIVVPTLDEEGLILSKLTNIRSLDYPPDLLSVWVVDGGSTDGTVALVREAIDAGAPLRLLCVDDCRGKLDQLRSVLAQVEDEYVVVTDADSELAPSCVRELVSAITSDPRTGLVGATVEPSTALAEELLHWRLLNTLWWLEGEVLSAAAVSGVCYAVRRSAIPPPPRQTSADDIHVAMAVASNGFRARICRSARAVEKRVPHTLREALEFRRRRGSNYLRELNRTSATALPPGWRIVRRMRLLQFVMVPWLAAAAAPLAVACLWTEAWVAALGIVAVPMLSLAAVAFGSTPLSAGRLGTWSILAAIPGHAALTWWALLSIVRDRVVPAPKRSPDGVSHAMADGNPLSRSSLPPPTSL